MIAITTEELAATNTRGLRVKAKFCDGPRDTLTVAWDYSASTPENHRVAAQSLYDACGTRNADLIGSAPISTCKLVHLFELS